MARILVVTDLLPPIAFGGYELRTGELVAHLRTRHDVVVLTSSLHRRRPPPDPAVHRVLPFVPRGRLRAALLAPAHALVAARRTRRLLAAEPPDLVYVANGAAIPQAAIAIAARAGAPAVCRFGERWYAEHFLAGDRFLRHLAGRERGVRRAWGAVARTVNRLPSLRLDLAPVPLTVSWNSAALRRDTALPPTVAVLGERVVHPTSAHAARLTGLRRRPAAAPLIAYVGRMTTAKGADVACRALAELGARHGIAATLAYAGHCRPPMRRALGRLAGDLGVATRVRILGQLGSDGLEELLSTAHALVVPTVSHEAYGLAAVEAALARVPVVASDVGGLPEALPAGCARFFPPGDAAACADALAATLRDPVATAAQVETAFAHVRAGPRFATEEERLIEDVLR